MQLGRQRRKTGHAAVLLILYVNAFLVGDAAAEDNEPESPHAADSKHHVRCSSCFTLALLFDYQLCGYSYAFLQLVRAMLPHCRCLIGFVYTQMHSCS